MAKPMTVLTPFDGKPAVELSRGLWRKQLLPVGEIEYKGRKLQFTKDYLASMARAFKERAFDQVPFQLANAENKHTNDPERFRGQVKDVELLDDGLYLVVETTDAGQEILTTNPSLGISARIYENYERSDGKKWPAAIQHVLGTLDPHIAGMKPWEAIATLSNDHGLRQVLDLTGHRFDGEKEVPVGLNDTDRTALRDLLKKVRDGGPALSDKDIEDLLADAESDDDDGELTDEELAELLDGLEEEEPKPVTVTNQGGGDALELANAQIASQGIELARLSAALDAETFEKELTRFVKEGGLPPKAIELARPLLEGTGHVIQLSNGNEADAGQVMRSVLNEISKTIKVLDLSDLIGNGLVPDDEKEERERAEQDTREFVKTARERFSL